MGYPSNVVFLRARHLTNGLDYQEEFAGDWARQGLHLASMLDDRSLVLLDARGNEVLPFDRRTT